EVLYNGPSIGSTSVSILGSPDSIHGAFSVYLYGGDTAPAASISQTAIVPVSMESILFWSQYNGQPDGTLSVSLSGQNIVLFKLATGPNRTTLYGGDVSAFAGQNAQLTFSATEGINNFWNIDDIQFSTSPIPEADTVNLLALSAFLFSLRR